MTYYQSFKKKYLGKPVVTNPAIGSHCLSYIKRYLYDKGGKPFSTGNRGAYALALGDIPEVKELCTIYKNLQQSKGILEGDILVFGRTLSNKYGHTALADEFINFLSKQLNSVKVTQQDGFIDNDKDGVADGVVFESHFPLHNLTAILRPHWVVEENEKNNEELDKEIKEMDNIRKYDTSKIDIPTDGNGNVSWGRTTRMSEPPATPHIATPFFPDKTDKVEAKEQNWTLVDDSSMVQPSVDVKKEALHSFISLLGGGGILSVLNETERLGVHISEVHYYIMLGIVLFVLALRLGVDNTLSLILNKCFRKSKN